MKVREIRVQIPASRQKIFDGRVKVREKRVSIHGVNAQDRSTTVRGGVAGFSRKKKPVTKSRQPDTGLNGKRKPLPQKFPKRICEIRVIIHGVNTQGRSATARGGVAGFSSKKKPVTKYRHPDKKESFSQVSVQYS
ncbi:MAG: hypothetical protein Q7R65_01180 [bacterium]|nr:hypothetical protein [bacterium]